MIKDWEPYIQPIAKAASRKVGSFFTAQHFLTPEFILYLYKSTIRPCMEYCSHIGGGAPRFHGLDLLDRVQRQVVSLVGSGLSSDLQASSHRWDIASISLFYKYYYGKCSSELADLIPLIQLIPLCAGRNFINQLFSSHDSPLELAH